MALEKPLWMQPSSGDAAITYSAQQDRAGLLSAVFSREGVLDVDAGQLKLSQRAAGANFSIDVATGRCAIVGDDASDQGTYLCTSTTVLNIATPVKPTSGSRRHRVIARVRDKFHNGSWTTYEWVIEILPDTGSGAPAQPASAITLGFINMTSTMTSVVTANLEDARPRATVGTADQFGTWASPGAAYSPADSFRPLTWRVNANSWVSLAGWLKWTDVNVALTAGQFYNISTVLPDAIRPSGIRDFIGITSLGPAHMRVTGSGVLEYRFFSAVTLIQNSSWFSFDGVGYRL